MSALHNFMLKYVACQSIDDALLKAARKDLNEIKSKFASGASPAYILDLLGVSLSNIVKVQLEEYDEMLSRVEFYRSMSNSKKG